MIGCSCRANSYLKLRDSPILRAEELMKRLFSTDAARAVLFQLVDICERGYPAEQVLRGVYRLLVGPIIFRGWRDGLRGTF